MVYKNFLLRAIFSLVFIIIYLVICIFNFKLVFYFIFLIYLFVCYEIIFNFKKYKFIPIIYILFSFLFFFYINFEKKNFLNFNLFIYIVISFDIFSYIIGKSFGQNKLITISPNKTIEGLLGGIIISSLSSIILSKIIGIYIDYKLLLFIFLVILFAFIGDIIESYFKRQNNLKNSSNFIPGHGGVFDRFDSFLFSIILYSIFINF